MLSSERGRQPRLHYAWVVVGITFLALLVAAGVRAAPGVLIKPLEAEFGWDRASISLAVAISILTFGLGGPLSGGLVDRFGPRRVMFGGMLVVGVGLLPLLVLTALPLILEFPQLLLFAIVYGLDWIATVPPTANLTAKRFGRASLGTLYGWIFFAHMLGAAIAAYIGGFFRGIVGDYHGVFISAALLGFVAVALSLRITPEVARPVRVRAEPARA